MIPCAQIVSENKGHSERVTSLSISEKNPEVLVTCSRDKSALLWNIKYGQNVELKPIKRLNGHSHFISDVKVSSDGQFCITGSWDKTIRLWDLNSGKNLTKFIGHTKEVFTISLSNDGRHIASGSADGMIKIWNSLGHCKESLKDPSGSNWISIVKFLPNPEPLILSCSWDGIIRIWNVSKKSIETKLFGHKGYIFCSTVSPDGSLCASGGKDGIIILWDLQEGKHLYFLNAGGNIINLEFSPNRYWLSAITTGGLTIWDLEFKSQIEETRKNTWSPKDENSISFPISSTWSPDGSILLVGQHDGSIKLFKFDIDDSNNVW